MSDILDRLTQARPQDLDRVAPGWTARREELLRDLDTRALPHVEPELDDPVHVEPELDDFAHVEPELDDPEHVEPSMDEPAIDSSVQGKPHQRGTRRRRGLLVAAAAALLALVVIIGAFVQTGQRVQPNPAQTISAAPLDPNRPVYSVGPGEFFLRRSTATASLGNGVQSVQRAVWFDDQGTMWSYVTDSAGTNTALGPLPATDAGNPLSFVATLPNDPAAAEKVLAKLPGGTSDSVQQATEANLTPNQYQVLRAVLLRPKGAKELGDATDSLSRSAAVVQTPGTMGTVLRFYFAKPTGEVTEVRTVLPSSAGSEREIGRRILVGEVRTSTPAPPFEPVVPSAGVPATQTMNRPLAPGEYLRRSVRTTTSDGREVDSGQWVDAQQRRWLAVTNGELTGPDEVPAPAGLTPQQYLAAMPNQIGEVDTWFVQGLKADCGSCLLARADALMLANLDAGQRPLVIAAIARQEGATDTPITDNLGRAARELRLEATVDGRGVAHVYRYDPLSSELLEWGIADSEGAKPSGVTWLTFLGSEVTTQPPG